MSQKQAILHRGEKFSAEKPGRFAKDVVHVGKWVHPRTGKDVIFTPERIQSLSKDTRRYLKAGNKIPFRDGHKNSVLANMGEWVDGFIPFKDSLVAVVEPKDPKAIEGIRNGSIDGVSVVIEFDVTDSKKNHYDEVITAVDATDFPVLTEQKEFVQLSKDAEGSDVYLPESMMLSASDNGDCMAQHESLHGDLKSKMADFASKKSSLGEHHPDTKAAASKMSDAALRLRKQAQVVHDHVQNMSGGPVYYDRRGLTNDAEYLAGGGNPNHDEKGRFASGSGAPKSYRKMTTKESVASAKKATNSPMDSEDHKALAGWYAEHGHHDEANHHMAASVSGERIPATGYLSPSRSSVPGDAFHSKKTKLENPADVLAEQLAGGAVAGASRQADPNAVAEVLLELAKEANSRK